VRSARTIEVESPQREARGLGTESVTARFAVARPHKKNLYFAGMKFVAENNLLIN